MAGTLDSAMFRESYANVFAGDKNWNSIQVPRGDRFTWADDSTYVRNPPYFEGMTRQPAAVTDITGARVLAMLGDSVTTDHISPAGSIGKDSPAGKYLVSKGVQPADFNQYGARRGNHEVMMRGTFANTRLRNQLVPGHRRRLHRPPARRREAVDLRRRHALRGRQGSAGRPGRQGVRQRFVPRLGRQGHQAAGRPRRHRGELRAHPSVQPDWHGRPAAGVPVRAERRVAGPHRPRGLRHLRASTRAGPGRCRSSRAATTARQSASVRGSASTLPRSATTSPTAASCTTSCGSWPAPARPPDAAVPDLIDVGANLTHESFRDDLPEVLERAARCGVRRLVVTGTSLAASAGCARTGDGAARGPVGHGRRPPSCRGRLRRCHRGQRCGRCCAIPWWWPPANAAWTTTGTTRRGMHSALPSRGRSSWPSASGRPLFLHQRDAHQDFLAILREQGSRLPAGVAHCFTNGPEEMAGLPGPGPPHRHHGLDLRRTPGGGPPLGGCGRCRSTGSWWRPTAPTCSREPSGRRPGVGGMSPRCCPRWSAYSRTFMGVSPEIVAEAATRNAEALFGLSADPR